MGGVCVILHVGVDGGVVRWGGEVGGEVRGGVKGRVHWSDGGGVGEACILFCPTPGAAKEPLIVSV